MSYPLCDCTSISLRHCVILFDFDFMFFFFLLFHNHYCYTGTLSDWRRSYTSHVIRHLINTFAQASPGSPTNPCAILCFFNHLLSVCSDTLLGSCLKKARSKTLEEKVNQPGRLSTANGVWISVLVVIASKEVDTFYWSLWLYVCRTCVSVASQRRLWLF